jgi:hypothetical protein
MGEYMKIENLGVKALRQRLFTKRSSELYESSEYTFEDHIPEEIEEMDGFTTWEQFSETWDVLWVGLDPRALVWIEGRHNSPLRKLVLPLRIIKVDERSKRMMLDASDKQDILKMEVPFKQPLPETEEDRIISKALSGKVVVDESDEDRAKRLLEKNIVELAQQLEELKKMAKSIN